MKARRTFLGMLGLIGVLGVAAAASVPAPVPERKAVVIRSPVPLPAEHGRAWIFLGGSIDMGSAVDWQAELSEALSDLEVVLLNPRRKDWDPTWRAEADEPHFREQVQWELQALEAADIVVMYFAPQSQSPVSLLELGLHARSGKLIVLCPPGYWRKGNVDLTVARYGIEQVGSRADLLAAVRRRVAAWRPGASPP